jgi:cysteine desulfurase
MNKTDYLYLDHAATSPMREVAFDAYKLAEQNGFANSSGGHALSRNAKNMLEDARDFVASCFGAAPSEITFTSSGTEADNWIIKTPFLNLDSKNKHIITSQIEHEAILGSAEWIADYGVNVDYVPPTKDGVIDIEIFKSKLTSNTDLVSFMFANNETGILQPIHELALATKKVSEEILFHSDVVQAVASEKIDFHKLGIDSAAISGHKIGGPKGIGIMFLSGSFKLPSLLHGGKQELERRAGTVNVTGAVAFAAALKEQQVNLDIDRKRMLEEKNDFEKILNEKLDIFVVGSNVDRLAHISNIQFKGINSETLMIALDIEGIGVSRGSACASGAQKPSHVLEAMKVDFEDINSHIRFSFGWNTNIGDGRFAAEKVISVVKGLSN